MFGDSVEAEKQGERAWFLKVILPVILVVLIAFSVFIYITARRERRNSEALASRGVPTEAILDNEYVIRRTPAYRYEYGFTYTFIADGKNYKGSTTTDKMPVDRRVRVIYLPDEPEVNRLEDPSLIREDHFIEDMAVIIGISASIALFRSLFKKGISWLRSAFR
jgi:hypothetical protein